MTYTQLLCTHPGVAQTKILIHRPLLLKHSVSVYFYNLIQKVNQNCSGSEPNRFCGQSCDFRKWIFFQHLCGPFTYHYFQSQVRKCTKERLGTGCHIPSESLRFLVVIFPISATIDIGHHDSRAHPKQGFLRQRVVGTIRHTRSTSRLTHVLTPTKIDIDTGQTFLPETPEKARI